MYETLEGEHIRLRKAREDDWRTMLPHVWSDEAVYRWMLFQPTLTEGDARDRARRSVAFQQDHFAWFVALADTDEAIGYCGMKEVGPGHFEESGICIGTAFQGRGYGREIVALLLDLAFLHLGAEDFRYSYFRENERSRRLAERFGLRYTHSYEITRPWDGTTFTSDSCLLTRDDYLARIVKPMETDDEKRGKGYVHWRSWQETYPGLIDQAYLDTMTLEKSVDIAFRWPEGTLVAKDGSRVIGFCAYGECRDEDLPGAGEIYAIYVLAEYYGMGVGRALMDAALARLDNPQIAVWVLAGNSRAIRFYEKCGFALDGAEQVRTIGTPVTELRLRRG
ncbi:MAG: GNAT family N-acetyltransferase [Eggerthellaceae bacterium]|nr:GNAT family N-acetyltransferase [Eggerthellaceae bacterium]